jgi:hypothetical protein
MLLRSVWVLFTALLALIGALDLLGSILESGSRFLRDPATRIAFAIPTAIVCFAALFVAVRSLRDRPVRRLGRSGAFTLTLLAVLMTFIFVIVSILSGPL